MNGIYVVSYIWSGTHDYYHINFMFLTNMTNTENPPYIKGSSSYYAVPYSEPYGINTEDWTFKYYWLKNKGINEGEKYIISSGISLPSSASNSILMYSNEDILIFASTECLYIMKANHTTKTLSTVWYKEFSNSTIKWAKYSDSKIYIQANSNTTSDKYEYFTYDLDGNCISYGDFNIGANLTNNTNYVFNGNLYRIDADKIYKRELLSLSNYKETQKPQVITVIKDVNFISVIGGEFNTTAPVNGVSAISSVGNDYTTLSGTIAVSGVQPMEIGGRKFIFNVIEPPTASTVEVMFE